jgi:hypothetical protein
MQDDPTLNLQQRHAPARWLLNSGDHIQTAFAACSVQGSDPARKVLVRFDERVCHYQTAVEA